MHRHFSILLILMLNGTTMQAQDKYPVKWSYADLSFTDFVNRAEANLPVRFFYKDEWISGLNLSDYKGCKDLKCILDNLFKDAGLYYTIDESGNIFITRNFAVTVRDRERKEDPVFISNAGYTDSLERGQKTEILYMEIGKRADAIIPGNVIISGYVNDSETGEPLTGVTVFVQKLSAGSVTNLHGHYSLSLPRGSHLIKFSFIGMRETRVNLKLNGPGELNISMKSILIPLKETVVSAERNIVLERTETGVEKINVPSFKMLPAFLGEPDLMKNLLTVTGVKSTGEGAAGFNVRGGSADQNLILIDGAQIYNSSHFFGFFSAINSDIIEDVTLYKGGMPARFGGRISSVLDIKTTDGSFKEFSGNAGISPVTAHANLQGPLINDTLSFFLAGRATYSNWLFGLIDRYSLKSSRASFYDLNGKLTLKLNRANNFGLSAYLSRDIFAFINNTVYNYDNRTLSINWKHFFGNRFFFLFTLGNSLYKYDIEQNEVQSEEYIRAHRINTTTFRGDFNLYRGLNDINFGMELNYNSLLPGSIIPGSDSSRILSHLMEKENTLDAAIFLSDNLKLTEWLSFDAGIRYSSFFAFGPASVYSYDPRYSKSHSTITDTIFYPSGRLVKGFHGPEPRISVNFKITGNSSLKLNYNRTRQYIHLLTNSASVSPADTWKFCDSHIRPETGDQYAAGFYQMLFGKKIETSVEVYYKDIRNMIDFRGGTTLSLIQNIEQDLINVKGKAYGVELSIKKSEGKFRYNIGYTYSRTFAKSSTAFRDETINEGRWYPANFDRPNDLAITTQYLYSRRLSFSANYSYSTGRPVTFPVSRYWYNDVLFIHYSDRNKYRLPDYSRLDISMKINPSLKQHRLVQPYWTLSLYNVFSKQNVYSVYFVEEGDRIIGHKLSVFGTAIPSVTFNIDF